MVLRFLIINLEIVFILELLMISLCLPVVSGYDVINPPVLSIQDSTGIGATGLVNVKGELERIDVIDSGFDYVTDPTLQFLVVMDREQLLL